MKSYILVSLLVLAVAIAPVMGVVAPPELPMSVSGTVYYNGVEAPVGTVVTAQCDGIHTGTASVTLDVAGRFGKGTFDQKIVVQGNIPTGTPVTFSVNGQPAQVKSAERDPFGNAVEYVPGTHVHLILWGHVMPPSPPGVIEQVQETEIKIVATPTPTPTPVPTTVPQTVSTPVPTPTPVQTSKQTEDGLVYWATSSSQVLPPQVEDPACPSTGFTYNLPTAVITDNQVPLLNCPNIPRYVPPGFGALYLGAWGSECKFYVDGVLVTNGGPVTLKGIPPGTYTVSYRETGYEPQDFEVTIGADRLVRVNINPVYSSAFVWDREFISPRFSDMADRSVSHGLLSVGVNPTRGVSVMIDGEPVVGRGCIDVVLSPGMHWVENNVGGYVSEYPVFIGAGTKTVVSGGSPVTALSYWRNTYTYTPSYGVYRGLPV